MNKPPTADVGVQVNDLIGPVAGANLPHLYVLGKAVLDPESK